MRVEKERRESERGEITGERKEKVKQGRKERKGREETEKVDGKKKDRND